MHSKVSKKVDKPWGDFKQFTHNELSTVKILTVKPKAQLSQQYHHKREELWIALDEGILVEIDGKETVAKKGQEFFIPKNALHRLSGGEGGGRVMEISFGEFDEEDIIRTEDIYGRAG